jgi:GGDEF domain-containing protein
LSLLLVQLDRPDELLLMLGAKDFEELRRLLEAACRCLDHPWMTCLAHGEAGFALILPNCQRRSAVELGDQLLRSMYALKSAQHAGGPQSVTLSVGVATVPLPPKNFSPEDLLSAAEHCLYGSRAGGGGVVKSIEI